MTYEEFIEKLYEKNDHFRNGEFEVIGTYVNAVTPIKCKCPEHGEFETLWANLRRGTGCPRCAGVGKKTHDYFLKELYKKNEHYKNGEFTQKK